ncbi:MAG TPA: aspartate aminotransferase family protein [Candidatus Thermoplasmatota archaeon]|nr:aspartate aminotransferase family protein [Candidatus Thermoplasmatota archaeon]
MDAKQVVDIERRRESGVFPKRSSVAPIVRGQGVWLWDVDGRRYLDCGANYGVGNVGHCHPRVVQAIRAQVEKLVFLSQVYHSEVRAEFFERLVATAPQGLDRVFLGNSGAEAIEAALKFARGTTRRPGIVAMRKSFHGRTFGAVSVTWKDEYRTPFEPLVPGVAWATYNDAESLKETVTRETGAILIEPVQGEGGVFPATAEFLRTARDLATDVGAVLVFDEIQTGFARTGRFWSCQHAGVTPDILAFAKSVAGGLPMGGILLSDRAAALPQAAHGNTFGGSPVACAAAVAVLDVIRDERLAERAETMGRRLRDGLAATGSDRVREVRGQGLMLALELREKNTAVLNALIDNGVLTLPTGANTVRYLPPLVIAEAEVDLAIAATQKALAAPTGAT